MVTESKIHTKKNLVGIEAIQKEFKEWFFTILRDSTTSKNTCS